MPIRVLRILLAALSAALILSRPVNAQDAKPSPILFGTLQTQMAHARDEYAGGTRLAMMEIFWDRYEKSEGVFDEAYADAQRRHLKQLRDAGFLVTLGLGTHYPPRWLREKDSVHFVDQNGAQSKDINFVFSQTARRYLERYLARIDKDLGLANFWAIRITSGGNGEMLYPPGGSYWAFDAGAQGGPDRPADQPICPRIGWKPGQPGLTADQVRDWADWYIRCLAETAGWQMHTLDALGYRGWYQILTPGSGMRPDGYEAAVRKNLPNGLIGVGAAWQKLYEFLPDKKRAVVYISSVADRSGKDDLTQPDDIRISLLDPAADHWSATRWQVRLAHEYGMPVGGENPGFSMPAKLNNSYQDRSNAGMMAHAIAQAKAGSFQCFYWAHSERLWDGTIPFMDYAAAIASTPEPK